MRPRHALTAAVLVVGVPLLLWYAWLVLREDLTRTTLVATVFLWLLAAAAVLTLAAFVREAGRHRDEGQGGHSWRPLPALVLLWVGGFTSLVVFPFMMSGPGS